MVSIEPVGTWKRACSRDRKGNPQDSSSPTKEYALLLLVQTTVAFRAEKPI